MKNFYSSLVALIVGIFLSTQASAQYCNPIGMSSTWDGIQRVATTGALSNFTNSTGYGATYNNYTGTHKVDIRKGSSFTLQITNSWMGNAWIDYNGDGDFDDPGEDLNIYDYKTTSTWGSLGNYTVNVPFSAVTGTSRLRVGCGYNSTPARWGPCGNTPSWSGYSGEFEDYAIEFIPPPPNDAGVSALKVPTICDGTNDLDIIVNNYGSLTLSSVVIEGSFGTTTYGPDTITGLSVPPGGDTILTLGQYTAVSGNSYTVNARTYFPNGVVDGFAGNDAMATQNLTPAMSGTYTIDPSGGGDYTSIGAALSDLYANDVCDTVIMNVVSGTYSGYNRVQGIVGAGPFSPVIFQSDTSNTSRPVITHSSNPLEFEDAAWVTFDGFEIETTSSFSDVIYLDNDNDHITFKNCEISKPAYTSTSNSYSLVYSSTTTGEINSNFLFENVDFINGSNAVYIYGSSSARDNNITFRDCEFIDQYYRYTYLYYTDGVLVEGCTFRNQRYNFTAYGLYLYYSDNSIIRDNTFDVTRSSGYGYVTYVYYANNLEYYDNESDINSGSSYRYAHRIYRCNNSDIHDNYTRLYGNSGGYGWYIYDCRESIVERNETVLENSGYSYGMWFYYPEGTVSNPFIIRNNIVNQTVINGQTTYGMPLYYPENMECLHNTIRIRSASQNANAVYVYDFGSNNNTNLRNNILINEGPSGAIYQRTQSDLTGRDNNVYYSAGACLSEIGGCQSNLAAMQTAPSGSDAGSINHMVDFFGTYDLHVFYDKVVNDVGAAAATIVPEDYDGEARDPLNPDPGMDEFQVPQNSVSLVSIDAPFTPVCGLVSDYDITVFNVGTGNLDSFNVDGVVRHLGGGSTTLPTYQHAPSGGVATGATASFNVGSLAGGFANGDTLELWVSNPNGVVDSILLDDTLMISLTEGLLGVFTVGDTATGTYDYPNLRSAQSLLDSVGAICDTVVFEVATGTYAGMEMPYLIGSNMNRPVIIRSMAGDADSVTINQAAGVSGAITLNGAGNVIIENVTLNGNNAGHALAMNGDLENVVVMNSKLRSTASGTSSNGAVVYSSGLLRDFHIDNSRISGGSYGFWMRGQSGSNRAAGIMINNNEILNSSYTAAYIADATDFEFMNNEISSNSSNTNGYGLWTQNVNGRIDVVGNYLNSNTDWPRYGIYASSTAGTSNFPANFENNVVKIGFLSNTNTLYGFYSNNSDFLSLNHNTIVLEGTNTNARAAYFTGGGGNELTNNILANMGTGYALYINGTFTVINSDHNDIFTNGNNIGYFNRAVNTFSSWQSTSGLDQTSVSEDPGFYSMTDLRVCSDSLDGRGTPTGVMYDFEGQMRDQNRPDIGADEFTAPSNFQLPADTTICQGDILTLNASLNSNTFAIWNNFQPSNSFTVTAPGIYKAFVANTCGQAIDSIEVMWADPVALSNDTHLCAGASFMADAGIASANGVGATYSWSTGASSQMINIGARGIYTVQVTDNIGCVSNDTISVTQSRAVSLPADTMFCNGNTYVVNANVGQGSYFWSPTGTSGPVVFINQSGTYRVNYTDNQSCTSTDEIVVDVVSEPMADYTYFQKYYTVSFTDLSSDAKTYMWTFGDGDTSYSASPAHQYAAPGTYTVTQYVNNDCGSDAKTQRITVSALPGFDEMSSSTGLSLFPNPNSGMFDLIIRDVEDQDLNVKVVTLDGKVLFDTDVTNSGVTELNIDLGSVAAGVYTVRVQGDNYSAVEKITIK